MDGAVDRSGAAMSSSPLHDIVSRLGGQVTHGGTRASLPGPGHSQHDRSLSLELDKHHVTGADRVSYFAHCGCGHHHGVVMDYLGLSEQQAQKQRPTDRMKGKHARAEDVERDSATKRAFCEEVWGQTRPLAGTVAVKYLASRGIVLGTPPPVLRYHGACPRFYPTEGRGMRRAPAMVALVQDRRMNHIGIHVTFLAPDGSAHDGRVMFGKITGGHVHLVEAGDELAICEGIETAFSYMDLRARPCWPLLSTSQFANKIPGENGAPPRYRPKFIPPREVKRLYVAVDMDDKHGTSLQIGKGMVGGYKDTKVIVDAPPPGFDWNSYARRLAA